MTDELLENVPIAILANKVDLPGAPGEVDLVHALGIYERLTGKSPADSRFGKEGERPLELFMTSLKRKFGYGDAFRWIGQFLK